MNEKTSWWLVGGILIALLLVAALSEAGTPSRIKDLAAIAGMDDEPLLGYGLVVGLNGTGDGQSSDFTVNSLTSMLERLGVTVPPEGLTLKNVAAVLVTARMNPSSAVGSHSKSWNLMSRRSTL